MQGIHRKERENRKSKQKEKNTLDSYRPSHGRSWPPVSDLKAAAHRNFARTADDWGIREKAHAKDLIPVPEHEISTFDHSWRLRV